MNSHSEVISGLIDRYLDWLKDHTALREVGDFVEITTPYLDRHNDFLRIYARAADDDIVLTDDGYTIYDLRSSGCDLTSDKRLRLLQSTLNGFGIQMSGDALTVRGSRESFPAKKHSLVQAMLAVNDLFCLA